MTELLREVDLYLAAFGVIQVVVIASIAIAVIPPAGRYSLTSASTRYHQGYKNQRLSSDTPTIEKWVPVSFKDLAYKKRSDCP